jgi:hypothetical protein
MTIGKASAPLPEITPKNQETFIGIGQLQSFGSESQAPVPANQGKSNLFSF